MTSRIWVLGHEPITIRDFTYSYSALAPDGRTLARLGQTVDRDRKPMVRNDRSIVTFDALRAGRETRTPISGLPEELDPARLGGWLNATEVTVPAVQKSPGTIAEAVYAVNVRTGESRELYALRSGEPNVVPGLVR